MELNVGPRSAGATFEHDMLTMDCGLTFKAGPGEVTNVMHTCPREGGYMVEIEFEAHDDDGNIVATATLVIRDRRE